MCRFSCKNSAFKAAFRFACRSRHVSVVNSSNRLNAKARTIQYWVFKTIRAKSDRGMGIWRQCQRDVPRLRPGEDDQRLTRQSCGRGGWFRGDPWEPIPRGLVRWEGGRVRSEE